MNEQQQYEDPDYKPAGKLKDKVALITGGDSGIGRAVALLFAKEGADVVVAYLDEHQNVEDTQEMILKLNRKCLTVTGNIADPKFCKELAQKAFTEFGKINILVNNAAGQLSETEGQDGHTFQTDVLSIFHLTKEVANHMQTGDSIINTAPEAAIISFTRSLGLNLINKGVRVNAVAPGSNQPYETAYSYLFLASKEANNLSGQVIHPNGGQETKE